MQTPIPRIRTNNKQTKKKKGKKKKDKKKEKKEKKKEKKEKKKEREKKAKKKRKTEQKKREREKRERERKRERKRKRERRPFLPQLITVPFFFRAAKAPKEAQIASTCVNWFDALSSELYISSWTTFEKEPKKRKQMKKST